MAQSAIYIKSFGGDGGSEFKLVRPKTIGLRTGSKVDQIKINDVSHGGPGGHESISLELGPDEYISSVKIRSGSKIDRVSFKTSKGRVLEGGGGGGSEQPALENIRVLSIGGRSGSLVDKLTIRYVENYGPSEIADEHANFILSYTPPFEEFETFVSSKDKVIHTYEKITQSMVQQKYSASAVGEYYVVASASTEIEFRDTSAVSMKSQLEQERIKTTDTKISVKEGYVGIHLVSGTLMQEKENDPLKEKKNNGLFWMYTTALPSYSIVKLTEIQSVLGHYDLTGQLHTQMTGLKSHKIIQNGYVYYK
jgi:hypothetical protein